MAFDAYIKIEGIPGETLDPDIRSPLSDGGMLTKKRDSNIQNIQIEQNEGHATLSYGNTFYVHCYLNEPGVDYRTTAANFWSLK